MLKIPQAVKKNTGKNLTGVRNQAVGSSICDNKVYNGSKKYIIKLHTKGRSKWNFSAQTSMYT